MANFTNTPPDWKAEGVEPTSEMKNTGFTAGYKPPASYFNWFWTKTSKCLAELQEKVEDAGKITVDSAMSSTSENPVQNKVINTALKGKASSSHTHTLDDVTETTDKKVMTAAERTKLSGISEGANKTVVDTAMSSSSTNPVQNKVINTALSGKSNTDHSHDVATQTAKGFMSNTDKTKLDGIATGANKTTVDSSLSSTSTNPVQNKVINTALSEKASSSHSHSNATTSSSGFLSSSDKSKLDGIAEGANKYSLPTASPSTLGGIKVGSNLSISNGVLSAEAGGVGKSLAGQSVSPTYGTSATAGEGAEIFNDYRDRTYQLLNGKYIAESGNIASGQYSHAEGGGTTASGDNSHAEGCESTASGKHSHAEGRTTTASGYRSHAEGRDSTAKGNDSHAEGGGTTASGDNSHAEGNACLAEGVNSHAEGAQCEAKGRCSHAGGLWTKANAYQSVIGKYNSEKQGCSDESSQDSESSLFIVGNGKENLIRSNAFRTAADGQSFGLKAFGASGADFAEYFEWLDGNPNDEDRRGKFVTLDGEKIKLANAGDFIVGVVSSMAAFIGNTSSEQWQGRYLQDVFGDWIQEEVEIPEKTDEVTGKVIPAHTAVQYALNPDYDPEQEYVARQFRKEWSPIGMLGQVVVVDDGTCTVGGFCNAGVDGIGTAAENGYKVMKRIDNTHVKVLVK